MAYIENEAGECDYYDVKLYRIKFTEKYPKWPNATHVRQWSPLAGAWQYLQ
jgi:hypothetical protein